jgi:hypothetical protein
MARLAITAVAFLIVVGVASFNHLKMSGEWDKLLHLSTQRTRRSGVPVVHGDIVQPGELQSKGTLYFVPMGKQVVPVQSLANYYDEKFQLDIKVLPEVPLDPSACLPYANSALQRK